ncbi:MAG: D-glycero-beta-D-manno-heptose-7-phosphate kinase [Gemmatimonadetes bacterium]|nr:D-glycero-beta-D-manno-heptose-7-phosphate kinase [Gemmatimonadota bacterium]
MERDRFDQILAGALDRRLVVLGDVMLDRYVEGTVDRISPEAPVPVVKVTRDWDAVGGAGNVAANVRTLGAACDLIGVVADDEAGDRVRAALDEKGVRHRFVADGGRPTTAKTRVLAKSQQVVRVDREVSGPVSEATVRALLEKLRECLAGADALIFEDYNKGVLIPDVIRGALDVARELGVPTVVDPKWEHFFAYGGATVFKPNRKELSGAMGEAARPDDAAWLEVARKRLDCTYLLLTLGADGMVLVSPDAQPVRARAVARSVYDVSGAGDTVSATFTVSLAAGATHAEAMTLATHAAAAAVGKTGVATVTPDEIWRSLRESASEAD